MTRGINYDPHDDGGLKTRQVMQEDAGDT
jgi:hypothetical protein